MNLGNVMNEKKVFIIAEAGVNHNGDMDTARKLVDAAAEAGADAVKFQTFKGEKLSSKFAKKAEYQKETTDAEESQLDMLKKLEFPYDEHEGIMEYCKSKGIMFLSTAFEEESADFLNDLGVEIMKIPSGEITNYPLLKKIGGFKKPIVISTGMSTLDEILEALKVLKGNGANEIYVLHCNTEYPTPFNDVNLKAMETIRKATGCSVGYSDHTEGIEVPIAAVAMGATIIEKHFTLDKAMEGPDHKASLNPYELKNMVSAIRNIEMAMGTGEKEPSTSEKRNIEIVRKSIVAKCDIKEGDIFTEENIDVKRPGNGISPMRWNEIIGKKATRDYLEDEQIIEK